ncbi:MAG: sugar phosphate nucleotidyltransferase [Patescibacteria group bacterium]|nr:sugar phosphate nucleotidyltransferase [Patescibacteria group bacterium]
MKVVLFAGGVGTRLWPLSRKHTPKQFEKIIGDKSTLQLAVDRVSPIFKPSDIFISSGMMYKDILHQQLPQLPKSNFILEPEMRDVGAAVGFSVAVLEKIAKDEPFIILWSDHIVKNEDLFRNVLVVVGKILEKHKDKIVFIGQKSRFASQNLGWIEFGDKADEVDGVPIYVFKSLHYRPDLDVAENFHASPHHAWNPGYFGTTPGFLLSLYKKYAPKIYEILLKIQEAWGTDEFENVVKKLYPQIEKISFDNLILEKIEANDGFVIGADLGWSDIGAWESLKEALSKNELDNATRGKVTVNDCKDSLVFNYTDQMVVGIDLDGVLVINTGDVVLVCPKNSVPKIKDLVKSLEGTPHEGLT